MPPKHLRSKGFLLFQPLTVGFTVEKNGVINEAPRRFLAGKNEIVTWIVGNASGEEITVSLDTFLRRDEDDDETGTQPVFPFVWMSTGDPQKPCKLKLADGQT